MVRLTLKTDVDESELCLGYKEIKLLFNVGPFPGGGNCLIIEADGEVQMINSNTLIGDNGDLEAYDIL